jgi:hypothetical protein
VDTAQEPLRTYATGQSLIFMFVIVKTEKHKTKDPYLPFNNYLHAKNKK